MDAITDPVRLRALAHPVRWKLIDFFERVGAATVTQCAEAIDESTPTCWYHLRILAKYGYLEQVPGSSGREKPWRRTEEHLSLGVVVGDSQSERAQGAVATVFLQHSFMKIAERLQARQSEAKVWRDASVMENATVPLTAAEMKAVVGEMTDLMRRIAERYAERRDPERVPEGAREVDLFFVGSVAPMQPTPREIRTPRGARPHESDA